MGLQEKCTSSMTEINSEQPQRKRVPSIKLQEFVRCLKFEPNETKKTTTYHKINAQFIQEYDKNNCSWSVPAYIRFMTSSQNNNKFKNTMASANEKRFACKFVDITNGTSCESNFKTESGLRRHSVAVTTSAESVHHC